MKTKMLISSFFFIALYTSVLAQLNKRPQFTISADAGSRVGHRGFEHSNVFGAALGLKYPLRANIALTLSAGYTSFINAYKIVGGDIIMSTTFNAIPLKAGLRYYMFKGLFGEGQLGAALVTNKDAKNGFLYTPGIGYEFSEGLGIGLRYES